MMSSKSKRELVRTVSPRYVTATGTEKARILDEFVATTGYHRKYALTLLNHPPRQRRTPVNRSRQRIYTPAVERALVTLWQVAGCLCAKRLVPFLPDLIEAMEGGELALDPDTRDLLLTLSVATADRLLAPARRAHPAARSLTKPGTLLRQRIPIRTFADWDDLRQKNWAIVRQIVGYERYEGQAACDALNALYLTVRAVVNYFQPLVRLVGKERVGSNV